MVTSAVLGAAGEHYVMSRLLLMGFTACLAPRGAPGIDILITDATGASLASLQVKTKRGRDGGGWRLTPKAETLKSERLFYAFVSFDLTDQAHKVSELLVVPSEVVSEYVRLSHQHWLDTPGKRGQPHNDSTVRVFAPNPREIELNGKTYKPGWTEDYKENWQQVRKAMEITEP